MTGGQPSKSSLPAGVHKLAAYIIRKLLLLVLLLLGITLFAFAILNAIPGDPVLNLVGERSSPEIIAQIRSELGADKGIPERYFGYLSLLAQGNLGRSHFTQRDIGNDLAARFPNTVFLAFCAMTIAIPAGILLGLAGAVMKKGPLSAFISFFTLAALSVPIFWNAIVFMLIFGLFLHILPPSGTGGVRYVILPALVLSIPAMAALARVTRTAAEDVATAPYVAAARARGLKSGAILVRHILRNALIPVVTIIGLEFGSYLNGAVVTETIFGWDGIGRYTMEGIIMRDYPVVLACILTGTILFVVINLITDILYHILDPRVRLLVRDR